MSCSLKKWVCDLPWMQQEVLFSAIRNCDSIASEGPHKTLVRGIRATCIKTAKPKGSFNARRSTIDEICIAAYDFVDNYIDHIPIHFVTHVMHAAEVIGYTHPDREIAYGWLKIYLSIVMAAHLNPETKEQFLERLQDDLKQIEREDKYDEECYRTKKYGDGSGTINETNHRGTGIGETYEVV